MSDDTEAIPGAGAAQSVLRDSLTREVDIHIA